MRKPEKTLDDLRDSRLMYDKDLPEFGYIMLVIITVFLVAAVGLSARIPRLYTIQSKGLITSEESNYVMCSGTGEIDKCCFKEGMLVEKGDVLFTIKNMEEKVQQEQLVFSKETYEKKVNQYKRLVKSIREDRNDFDDALQEDSLYYSMFEAYRAKIAQNDFDSSMYADVGYSKQQIQGMIEKHQGEVAEIYYSAIEDAENAIADAEMQIELIDSQLQSMKLTESLYEVKATASGVLHLLGEYKSGMMIQAASVVATITPKNSEIILKTYVSTENVVRIQEGDKVQIVVDGLVQNVYGTISGTVKQIDSNVSTQELSNGLASQVFKVLISLDNDYVVGKSGDKVQIVNGMSATARIQYDKLSYLDYVLEKVGMKVK